MSSSIVKLGIKYKILNKYVTKQLYFYYIKYTLNGFKVK